MERVGMMMSMMCTGLVIFGFWNFGVEEMDEKGIPQMKSCLSTASFEFLTS